MADFELKSEYQPTGDQPAAIGQLTKGLQDGLRNQTLLGVTGSGKSVVAGSPVLVQKAGRIRESTIGEVVNDIFAHHENWIQTSGDSEFVNLNSLPFFEQVMTVAFDTQTGTPAWRLINQVSRHPTKSLLKTTTTCGRSLECTTDHNFYVARNGALELMDGQGLEVGDWLPLPDTLEGPQNDLRELTVHDYLDNSHKWYCEVSPIVPELASVVGVNKFWRMSVEQERVSLSSYRAFQATSGIAKAVTVQRVGSVRRRAVLPATLCLSPVLLRFLGYFIAEGHAADRYIILSTADQEIRQDLQVACSELGLPLVKRQKPYDYQVSSTVLAHLMRSLCGHRAEQKRLPEFWPQLSNTQLAEVLRAYFAGDGWVESSAVAAATVSESLASQLQYALLRFGIHARKRLKRLTYKDAPRTCWVVSISGVEAMGRFNRQIGFALQRKQIALEAQLQKSANTNVDLIPISGTKLRAIRKTFSLGQEVFAAACGVSRTYISLLESGRRLPSRIVAARMATALENVSRVPDDQAAMLATELRILLELHWTRIAAIERLQTDCMVYDFAVDGYETFLTGAGGLFVHNTFTMANLIQNTGKPTLVLSHNKTLAAQLYEEFRRFFPNNAVHYFVSYFDYYQPEAYIARSDTYIEKDSQINEEIDRLRHAATDALLSRRDVIIVASVSCIYGIGSVEDYDGLSIRLKAGERRVRDKLLRQLTDIQYQRNDVDFHRSTFRVRGDVVDVFPAGEELAYRLEFFGDEIERIIKIDPLTGEVLGRPESLTIFPGSHYVTPHDKLQGALGKIETELEQRVHQFKTEGKLLEAQRISQRTRFDIEMLQETGFVKGIENYSRYLTNRAPGEQPATLLDYYPDDYLLLIDESHMTIPQVRGMYNGDRARKEVLVEYGFRLPSALDNRPLTFTEFEKHINQTVYVSATPAEYELSRSPKPAQQVIRPTGLLDPKIEVRPVDGQVDDLIAEIRSTVEKHQRVLVTTLTKRMSEDLTEYLKELNIKVAYLHSDVDTLDRSDILRDLRLGVYDVLVGINLLREGLDLPEVSLVAILDADKEGFLRSSQALIQTVGRAARHVEGRVIMYADHITASMRQCIDETDRRRAIQEAYNTEHGITPTGISKSIEKGMRPDLPEGAKRAKLDLKKIPKDEYGQLIKDLTGQMDLAAANLQFEQAAELRDLIADIKNKM